MTDDEGRIKHAAKTWVEANFPAANGSDKALLILVYGCGFDAGMVETMDMLRAEMARQTGKDVVNGYPR